MVMLHNSILNVAKPVDIYLPSLRAHQDVLLV